MNNEQQGHNTGILNVTNSSKWGAPYGTYSTESQLSISLPVDIDPNLYLAYTYLTMLETSMTVATTAFKSQKMDREEFIQITSPLATLYTKLVECSREIVDKTGSTTPYWLIYIARFKAVRHDLTHYGVLSRAAVAPADVNEQLAEPTDNGSAPVDTGAETKATTLAKPKQTPAKKAAPKKAAPKQAPVDKQSVAESASKDIEFDADDLPSLDDMDF